MKKRTIVIILLIFLSIGIISVYTTFAYNSENSKLEESTADYNLIYSLKEKEAKQVIVSSNEEKYIDITLNNTYESTVKYGIYYYAINPEIMPDSVSVSLSTSSKDLLEDIIKPNQTKNISIKITNNSDYQIELLVGALVGFENGKIEDLVQDGEVLIK